MSGIVSMRWTTSTGSRKPATCLVTSCGNLPINDENVGVDMIWNEVYRIWYESCVQVKIGNHNLNYVNVRTSL